MTRRMLVVRSTCAALALAVAALAVLVGIDVLRWRGNDEHVRAQIALAAGDAPIQPGTVLPATWSRSLLGAGDAVALNRLLARWQRIVLLPFRGTRAAAAVGNAELELERLSKSRALSARARSDALLLHSILLLQELGGQATTRQDMSSLVVRPLAEMRRALLTDPSNAFAKYDIEVALRIYPPNVTRVPQPGTVPVIGAPHGVKGGRGQGGTSDVGGGF